jgi:hypothetical protein
MPGINLDSLEDFRRCKELLLSERLAHQRVVTHLNLVLTSLRWWAVADLCWMLRESLEVARYAYGYPASWAYKLSALTAHPWLSVAWFSASSALIAPLIVMLAVAPRTNACRQLERVGCAGLFMSGVGYAVLASFAARLDIPHVVDSYRGSTTMLLVTGLLLACWHNSRMLREEKERHLYQPRSAVFDARAL